MPANPMPQPPLNPTPAHHGLPDEDIQAVMQWLYARGRRSPHTFAAYKREAEKLLNWAAGEGKTLRDLSIQDIGRYLHHLEHDKAAKPSTVMYSRRVLNQMYQYLCDLGYLARNAVKLTPLPAVPQEEVPTKFLDLDAWIWLWKWLTARPAANRRQSAVKVRDRWLFALVYHTGMRREEVAKASMSDLQYRNGRWTLRVLGKRNKVRHVSIHSVLLQELKQYRTALGLPELPDSQENFGLIIPLKGDKSRRLTPRAIGLMVHECREAALADCDDDPIRIQLINMSTHWLRHTNTTHRYMAGASTETIQDEQGHADPKTTRIYLKTLPGQRQQDAEKLAELHANAVKDS